jgi:prepilin-type N-terminal cleavage/methylation domain-containing protein
MLLADTPGRGEHGFSLIESVIAVAVLGIIVSAMVGGMATAIATSALNRQKASANAVMVSAAEVVKHLPYQDCQNPDYQNRDYSTAIPRPSGWSISIVVQYWDPSSDPPFRSTCPSSSDGDNPGSLFGMQLVTILVTVPGTALTRCPLYSGRDSIPKSTSCIAVVKRKP